MFPNFVSIPARDLESRAKDLSSHKFRHFEEDLSSP